MSTSITNSNGTTIIMSRNEATAYEGIYKHTSSTEGQPYVAINFKDGKPVGGSTLTESQKIAILSKAQQMNWTIK